MTRPIPPRLRRTYDLLGEIPNHAVDDALAGVLPGLGAPLRKLAVEKLVERGNPNGLVALVAGYKSFDSDLRALVREHVGELFEAARRSMASDSVETRLSTIELIESSRNCKMAYLLSEVLPRRCPRTTVAAAAALLALAQNILDAQHLATDASVRRCLRGEAEHLAAALQQGLDSWPAHHRIEVLQAAMMLVDVMEPVLMEKISQTRTNIARAVTTLLGAVHTPAFAPFTLRALKSPELRGPAADAIGTAVDPLFIERLVDEMWITVDSQVAKGLAAIRRLAWLENDVAVPFELTGSRPAHTVALVALSGIPQDRKHSVYRAWLDHPCHALREAVVWQLARVRTPDSTAALKRIAATHDGALSPIAALELFRRDPNGAGPNASPDDATGHRWSPTDVDAEFDRYWGLFDRLEHAQRVRDGKRLRRKMGPRFQQRVAEALVGTDPVDRSRALRCVRALGTAHELAEKIVTLCHDPDDRIRSLAVAACQDIEGATAVRVLRRALHDADPRVQANAIEVISDRDVQRWKQELSDRLGGEHNRVRANAIKALLRHRERDAAVALVSMLTDPAPSHRISALWVVEQLGLVSLMPRVQRIAAGDPDPRVRRRAERLLAEQGIEGEATASTVAGPPRT